jgi:hypothetical protein
MKPTEELFMTPAQAARAWIKKHAALKARCQPLFFMLAFACQGSTRIHSVAALSAARGNVYDNGRRRVNELVKLGYLRKAAVANYTPTTEGLAAMGIRAKKGAES